MASTAPPREDEVIMGDTDQGPERAPPVSAPAPATATAEPTKQIEFSFVSNGFKHPVVNVPAAAADTSTHSDRSKKPLTAKPLFTTTASASPDLQANSDKTSEEPWVQVKSLSQKHRESRQRAARRSAAHTVAEDLRASLFTGAPKVYKKKLKGKFSFPSKSSSSFSSAGSSAPPLLRPTITSSPTSSLTYSEVTMNPNRRYNKSAPMAIRIEGAHNRAPALCLATLWTELPAFPGRGSVLADYLKRVLTSDPTIHKERPDQNMLNPYCLVLRCERVGLHPKSLEDLQRFQNNPIWHEGQRYMWVPDAPTEIHIHIAGTNPKITAPQIETSLIEFGAVRDLKQVYHIRNQWCGDWEAILTLHKGRTLLYSIRLIPADSEYVPIDKLMDYEVVPYREAYFCIPCLSADTRVCLCRSAGTARFSPRLVVAQRPTVLAASMTHPSCATTADHQEPPSSASHQEDDPFTEVTADSGPTQEGIDEVLDGEEVTDVIMSEDDTPTPAPQPQEPVEIEDELTAAPAAQAPATPTKPASKKRPAVITSPSPICKKQSQLFKGKPTAASKTSHPLAGPSRLRNSQTAEELETVDQEDDPEWTDDETLGIPTAKEPATPKKKRLILKTSSAPPPDMSKKSTTLLPVPKDRPCLRSSMRSSSVNANDKDTGKNKASSMAKSSSQPSRQ
ncbi:hypothetical protein H4219_006154 [Mycoemilia scoparia]|uniref:Uncharacterized protein n=1 Tax=Mycoemilia scoparia TaxID=417184 RepID=A0A9W7ZLD4_9FUNG|nr:hypothetical protein H4219_006154 [Mycoemilia scoparia]